jgi:competence protein ComEA
VSEGTRAGVASGGVADLDRSRLVLYLALGLAVCALGARYLRAQRGPPDAGHVAAAPAGRASGAATGADGAGGAESVRVGRAGGGRVTVHVAGAVRRPGLYRLRAGARIDDAVRRAGGPRRRADLSAINLAARLEDGRQVLVPERAAGAPSGAAVPGAGGTAAGGAPAAPVNLNTATLEQLDTLDGVGPGIAQRILDYREEHGGFGAVDELGRVPGIGPKRMQALRDRVTA